MMYMVLHAEAVLDLVAVRDREIQFRQVAGSFVTLQGKFLLHADPQVSPVRARVSVRASFRVRKSIMCPVSAAPAFLLNHRFLYEQPECPPALRAHREAAVAEHGTQPIMYVECVPRRVLGWLAGGRAP